MSAVDLPEEEWLFEKLLDEFNEYEGIELRLRIGLIDAYEFSRELVQRHPLILKYRSGGIGLTKSYIDHYLFWKFNQFPSVPWFDLEDQIKTEMADQWINQNLDSKEGINMMRIDLSWTDREIIERVNLARNLWNEFYSDTEAHNIELNRKLGSNILKPYTKNTGGKKPQLSSRLIALGKERFVQHLRGQRSEAKRQYHEIKCSSPTVTEGSPDNDKSFYECKKITENVLNDMMEYLPKFIQNQIPKY
jgi:hypothetical protein